MNYKTNWKRSPVMQVRCAQTRQGVGKTRHIQDLDYWCPGYQTSINKTNSRAHILMGMRFPICCQAWLNFIATQIWIQVLGFNFTPAL